MLTRPAGATSILGFEPGTAAPGLLAGAPCCALPWPRVTGECRPAARASVPKRRSYALVQELLVEGQVAMARLPDIGVHLIWPSSTMAHQASRQIREQLSAAAPGVMGCPRVGHRTPSRATHASADETG
jgi:hypothetical protein